MKTLCTMIGIILLLATSASTTLAQGSSGRGFGAFNISLSRLLGIEAVQNELEMIDGQLADIEKLNETLREDRSGQRRPNFGGGRSGGFGGGGRREFTEEQRKEFEEMRKKAEKERRAREKKEEEALAEILLPHQLDRLHEIRLQAQGAQVLLDTEVAKKIGIDKDQSKKLQEVADSSMNDMREKMREIFQGGGGDFSKLGEIMTKVRKETEENMLVILTDKQKEKLDELKGKPFELPQDALRSRFGGRGGSRGGSSEGRRRRPPVEEDAP